MTNGIYEHLTGKGGRFLNYNTKLHAWEELTAMAARDKVGHALRFANRKIRGKGSTDSSCSTSSSSSEASKPYAADSTATFSTSSSRPESRADERGNMDRQDEVEPVPYAPPSSSSSSSSVFQRVDHYCHPSLDQQHQQYNYPEFPTAHPVEMDSSFRQVNSLDDTDPLDYYDHQEPPQQRPSPATKRPIAYHSSSVSIFSRTFDQPSMTLNNSLFSMNGFNATVPNIRTREAAPSHSPTKRRRSSDLPSMSPYNRDHDKSSSSALPPFSMRQEALYSMEPLPIKDEKLWSLLQGPVYDWDISLGIPSAPSPSPSNTASVTPV